MKTPTILLIEDDELDTISVERSLKKLEIQYELHTAYNGLEALHLLRGETGKALYPDVILLDINMPRMNGIEFLKIIRGDEKLKDLKVFIMTTSSESNDRINAENLGISGYIIKPLNYTDNTKRPDSMDAFVQFHLRKILLDESV
ncbi:MULTISPECIES: response regulator [unclassified Flavobacterium]|jgi:CheY-like chemotaxis protein|uniref:response regulator n=1 Tax=unclassified Flavobacterium TaxID=196869 RepID=UPI001064D3ED|nr:MULTISPECIES: response regulator [unclassified Flavobacterium]MDQ1166063.1 CheY-like chemotaxis protein [Flavobacterium sp. SORGH_AS_0622]TDX08392.1 CheY-like chemotaxis protein [Flavobacterium sp. S87F.05.LMB.W.Kidney.N]BDU26613.1 response regulator [Flavobacterium sp. GSB-24]